MTDYLFTAILPHTNGLTEDRYVNTFAVKGANPGSTARDGIMQAIEDFYTLVPTGGLASIAECLSADVSRVGAACEILAYDIGGHLDGSAHGAPVDAIAFTMPAAANSNRLPQEVAYVLTLESQTRATEPVEVPDDGDPDSKPQRPMQRHTGRIYLGPLGFFALDETSGRPDVAIRDTVHLAAIDMSETIHSHTTTGTGTEGWAIWSRTDAVLRPVHFVSSDNAFDTQRRRGVDATARVRVAV